MAAAEQMKIQHTATNTIYHHMQYQRNATIIQQSNLPAIPS